jgi:hypothetical protein
MKRVTFEPGDTIITQGEGEAPPHTQTIRPGPTSLQSTARNAHCTVPITPDSWRPVLHRGGGALRHIRARGGEGHGGVGGGGGQKLLRGALPALRRPPRCHRQGGRKLRVVPWCGRVVL